MIITSRWMRKILSPLEPSSLKMKGPMQQCVVRRDHWVIKPLKPNPPSREAPLLCFYSVIWPSQGSNPQINFIYLWPSWQHWSIHPFSITVCIIIIHICAQGQGSAGAHPTCHSVRQDTHWTSQQFSARPHRKTVIHTHSHKQIDTSDRKSPRPEIKLLSQTIFFLRRQPQAWHHRVIHLDEVGSKFSGIFKLSCGRFF